MNLDFRVSEPWSSTLNYLAVCLDTHASSFWSREQLLDRCACKISTLDFCSTIIFLNLTHSPTDYSIPWRFFFCHGPSCSELVFNAFTLHRTKRSPMSILSVIGWCNCPRKGVQLKPFIRLQLFTMIYVK